MSARPPFVVGIGGSTRPDSLTDALLRHALDLVERRGARTAAFTGAFLAELPIYAEGIAASTQALELIGTVGQSDAIILASPGYHGAMSGLIKNGLDHLEALRGEDRPYLDGRAVGILVAAAGWQACGTAVVTLRSTVHALRGWPTPFAAAVNSADPVIAEGGGFVPRVAAGLQIVADQVMDFVGWRRAARRNVS